MRTLDLKLNFAYGNETRGVETLRGKETENQ